MGYATYEEAARRGFELVPVGSTWLKDVGGNRMIVQLVEEGKLTEWREDQPENTWTGFWTTGARYEYPEFITTIQITVGDYEARISCFDEDAPKGYEVERTAYDRMDGNERRLMDSGGYPAGFPIVTLTRLT